MILDTATIDELARALADAEAHRAPIDPLTATRPELTAEDAYAVQQAITRRRRDAGDELVGWKVGLTSKAMQDFLGVDTPDYGPVLSSMRLADGDAVSRDELIAPRVEGEVALVLGQPLKGPGVTAADVAATISGAAAAMEVIDSRIRDWRISLPDTVADLASCARVVVAEPVAVGDLALDAVTLELRRNGEVAATGRGDAVLGSPLEATAWAANTLGSLGETLEPGQIIMPGALHAAVGIEPGDELVADFAGLGTVTLRVRP